MTIGISYILRFMSIIRHVRRNRYISSGELLEKVERELILSGFEGGFSKRTLQRDLKEIRQQLDISILYSKMYQGYYIPDDENTGDMLEYLLEHINLLCALRMVGNVSDFMFTESRNVRGVENLFPLVHAIKKKLTIEFDYQKFTDKESVHRVVEPYALKEFNGRWYLLSREIDHNTERLVPLKTWGLDRMVNLVVSGRKFDSIDEEKLRKEFQDCFGIYSNKECEVEDVILSFDTLGGCYAASRPLHQTQEVLVDDEKEFRIRLRVRITWDFILELLSQTDNVTVISPSHLRETLIGIYQRALTRYV